MILLFPSVRDRLATHYEVFTPTSAIGCHVVASFEQRFPLPEMETNAGLYIQIIEDHLASSPPWATIFIHIDTMKLKIL
jgi:hypothetical protein